MNKDRVQEVIQSKNDQRERHALITAAQIVEAIIAEQQSIARAQTSIQRLRKELADLEVETLDPTAILGK